MADNFLGTARPLSRDGFNAVVAELDVDEPSMWALLSVETRGFGFMSDRRPKVLFERHVFHRRTQGRFDATHADISAPTPGGYEGGAKEYARLQRAMALDQRAALESTSWGLGQIMGFNAAASGYADAASMVRAFIDDEDTHFTAVARFIQHNPPLLLALRRKDWAKVAFFYNGKAYAERQYHVKLARFHDLFYLHQMPDLDIRLAQARLTYLGYAPGGVDGVLGSRTRMALIAFQKARRLPSTTGELDEATRTELQAASGV